MKKTFIISGFLLFFLETLAIINYYKLKDELVSLEKINNVYEQAHKSDLEKKLSNVQNENEELREYIKELETHNIAFQNSLKIAASTGIVPQNYTKPEMATEALALNEASYVGTFMGTAYTPSNDECGNNLGITYSGKPIIPGTSIAVDTSYWPIGTEFYIKGLGIVKAMDTGSSIKGKYRFDFAVFDKNFAYALGTREWEVYLIKMGNGILT